MCIFFPALNSIPIVSVRPPMMLLQFDSRLAADTAQVNFNAGVFSRQNRVRVFAVTSGITEWLAATLP